MDYSTGGQKNRVYEDYCGHPACQGCEVLDYIVCPLIDAAHDKNRHMRQCDTLRPFGEKLIAAIYSTDKRRKLGLTNI